MYRVSVGAPFGLRCGVVALLSALTVMAFAGDTADARWKKRKYIQSSSARVTVETKLSRRAPVRSSTGETEARLFVKAHVRLGGREQQIEVGLVDRRHMLYRMLLGRSALERKFLVDVSRRYALGGNEQSKPSKPRARANSR